MPGPALLFCPADRPERYAKALAAADAVIIDLEDAVAPADKASARAALVAHEADPDRAIVRVNAAGGADHQADLEALAGTAYRTIMLAKAESGAQLDGLAAAGYRVIALCETALGVKNCAEIAGHPAVVGVMWARRISSPVWAGARAGTPTAPTAMSRDTRDRGCSSRRRPRAGSRSTPCTSRSPTRRACAGRRSMPSRAASTPRPASTPPRSP
jgi:citrate lyase subunit beta/citryl-CoA lyase